MSDDPLPQLRFKLVVAYDGANYSGWQVQKTGVGVQEKVEMALKGLFPSAGRIHGSSRTDTGVHAMGMVVHFDILASEFKMPIAKLAIAINAGLPEDVRVMKAVKCAPDFHARFDARGKQYRYVVWNDRAMNPLMRRQAWHVPQLLKVPPMVEAAELLLGRQDFKSFAANRNYEMESTVRTLTRCDVRKKGRLITFIIEGDGFLYKMCRGIAGTLIQVGQGRFSLDDVKEMLVAKDRSAAGVTAPAHGLVLWKVFYDK